MTNRPEHLTTETSSSLRRGGLVLAAVDLCTESEAVRTLNRRVLHTATAMADLLEGELHLVAVTPLSKVLHDLEIIDERVMSKRVAERTAAYVSELLEAFDLDAARICRPVGKVGPMVASVARQIEADLLVVGRGRHPVRQALRIGSGAEQIIRHAPCDVLTTG